MVACTKEDTKTKFFSLIWEAELEYRYQTARSSFLDRLEKSLILLITFLSIIELVWCSRIISALCLIGSIGLIVYATNKKCTHHLELKTAFAQLLTELEEELEKDGDNQKKYFSLKRRLDDLMSKTDEPYRVLEALCYNEQLLSKNYDRSMFRTIPKWKAWLKNIFRFSNFDLL